MRKRRGVEWKGLIPLGRPGCRRSWSRFEGATDSSLLRPCSLPLEFENEGQVPFY